jgi:hypothetical protein
MHAEPSGEERACDELRAGIRHAGNLSRGLRVRLVLDVIILGRLFAICTGGAALALEWAGTNLCGTCRPSLRRPLDLTTEPFLMFLAGAGCGLLLALPIGRWHRQAQTRALWRRLASLSPEHRLPVLLPLQDEASADTRAIVKELLDTLAQTPELAPAAAPKEQGSEVSPAAREG